MRSSATISKSGPIGKPRASAPSSSSSKARRTRRPQAGGGGGRATSCMNGARTFVDTNVLVYSVDRGAPDKRARARTVLAELGDAIVISTQVLLEFYVTVTRTLASTLSIDEGE